MNSVKNTLLLLNGNIDNSSEYNSKQIGDQSGNYWISKNANVSYSNDTLNTTNSNYHKSILFNENSECVSSDHNHLFNFSDREFSIDAWVKFETSEKNKNKNHTIISKWDNTGSPTDSKVFKLFYQNIPTSQKSEEYYIDVDIDFSSNDVLINGNSPDTFEFLAGNSYRLKFSVEYTNKSVGIPEVIEFKSTETIINDISEFNIDLSDEEFEEPDDLDDLLIENTDNLQVPDFVQFADDEEIPQDDNNPLDYMRSRYGVLHEYITEVDGGILLNLLDVGSEFGDIDIEISTTQITGTADTYESDIDLKSDIVNSISLKKKINYSRLKETPGGKFVFEFNGIRGYESENRNIKIEKEFVYNDKLYEASDDNTFYPSKFSEIIFSNSQLENMNPDVSSKLNDTNSKVWISKVGLLIYPKFTDFEQFYLNKSKLNVGQGGDEIDIYEYEKYLSNSIDQQFLFLPIESYDEVSKKIVLSEYNFISDDVFDPTLSHTIRINHDNSFISDDGYINYSFDYLLVGEKDIVVRLFEEAQPNTNSFKWKKSIRLQSSSLKTDFSNVEDFLKDIESTGDELLSGDLTETELDDVDATNYSDINLVTKDFVRRGNYSDKFEDKYDIGLRYKIDAFIAPTGSGPNNKLAHHFPTLITEYRKYKIEAFDITNYVSSGFRHEIETENLIDGEWHHLYFGRVGLASTDEDSGNEKIFLGVDGNLTTKNISFENNNDFPYLEFEGEEQTRKVKLTSIQPYYEAVTGKVSYEKLLSQSIIKIGSDNQSVSNNFIGKLDSLRVNEFLTFENQQQLREYVDNKSNPDCWIYISDSNNYCIYDENTKYNLSGRGDVFGVELIDVMRYTDTPSNKFEALKHEMGSVSYIKKFVEPDFDSLSSDEKQEVINSWRWQLKFVIPVNETIKTKDEIESQLEYADEYLEKEILNGK